MNIEYEAAQTSKRIGAFIIDATAVFLLWYLFTKNDLEKVNNIMLTLDPLERGSVDIFAREVIGLYVIFTLKYIFVQTLYYTLLPAVIGRGKTIGKLAFGISMLHAGTLEEITPSRLILREFILRCLFETVLVVPYFISVILVIFTRKAGAIHDLWAKTVVVSDSCLLPETDE